MKAIGIPHQYACFACRKSFKRPQFSGTSNHFMTSAQQQGQAREAAGFNEQRAYRCPDCGGDAHFMGTDFKAPRKTDVRAWQEVRRFIESGQLFHRASHDATKPNP